MDLRGEIPAATRDFPTDERKRIRGNGRQDIRENPRPYSVSSFFSNLQGEIRALGLHLMFRSVMHVEKKYI